MLYKILYLFSLIPLRILYGISDLLFYLLYYVIKYRRKVVSRNIKKSFISLSEKEQIVIEKQFYKNFCDNLVETLKLLSISEKELQTHITADYSELEKVLSEEKKCHIYLGHQFNWELANAHISSLLKNTDIVVVYKSLSNQTANNFMLKLRRRFGSKMISSKNMKRDIKSFEQKQHILILAADQNPNIPQKSFWASFLFQRTAFLSGTELYTTSNKTTSFFANIIKVKRGHYKFVITPLFDFSKPYQLGIITHLFTEKLENAILANPENYLWSHKRWKHLYKNEYKKRWISDLQYH